MTKRIRMSERIKAKEPIQNDIDAQEELLEERDEEEDRKSDDPDDFGDKETPESER